MDMYYKKAKPISYGNIRDRDDILYIVFHYTGNDNDTAKNNVDFYANVNTRNAGAHFFVDQEGNIGRSIAMNRVAWSVGGNKYANAGGSCYGKITNDNSVSIELCAITKKEPSDDMVKAVKELLKYIQKYCPNATTLVRHYDVTGKLCPATMVDNDKWGVFLGRIGYTLVGKTI